MLEPSVALPAASSLVSVRHQPGRGRSCPALAVLRCTLVRFAVAARDIEVGTVLLREQPVTWTLHPAR